MITTNTGVAQIPVTLNGEESHGYNLTKNGQDTFTLPLAINGVVQLPPS